jgi:hypothetical protein
MSASSVSLAAVGQVNPAADVIQPELMSVDQYRHDLPRGSTGRQSDTAISDFCM